MSERIHRKADRKVYQPRIHQRRIRELYYVKELTGRPMTVLVDEAIAIYLSSIAAIPKLYKYQTMSEVEQKVEGNQMKCDPASLNPEEFIGNLRPKILTPG